jgi:hypothetical protein
MPRPVILDDGGSTRIKLFDGRLDDLLDVSKTTGKPYQSFATAIGPLYQIKVVCIDKSGTATQPEDNGFPIPMPTDSTFEIQSGHHRVAGKIVSGNCEITVKGADDIEPIVEARQSKGQRRYIISNAPAIDRIIINSTEKGFEKTIFEVPPNTIYTAVILD